MLTENAMTSLDNTVTITFEVSDSDIVMTVASDGDGDTPDLTKTYPGAADQFVVDADVEAPGTPVTITGSMVITVSSTATVTNTGAAAAPTPEP